MFAFVILHYKSLDETIHCLQSIKDSFDKKRYKIIVVDNNSLKEKEIKKVKAYTKDIIILEQNLGFAKANNIGCRYAIKKYNPDYVIVINNDVFIKQKEFLDIIEKDYATYKFDMLGPHIDSPTGESCNPFPVLYDRKNILSTLKKSKILKMIYSSSLLYILLCLYIKIKHFFIPVKVNKNGEKLEKNIGLHGCAIIFSKKYLSKYPNAFYDETFLFYEEEFLFLRVKKENNISVYDPRLKIFHKEGSSMKKNSNVRKSKLFKETEKIKSLELLLKRL